MPRYVRPSSAKLGYTGFKLTTTARVDFSRVVIRAICNIIMCIATSRLDKFGSETLEAKEKRKL